MVTRVERLFARARAHAARALPWLARARMRYCRVADQDHARKWRLFAHSNERPYTACWARAADTELTDKEILGIAFHELGHIVGETLGFPEHLKPIRGPGTPWRVQAEADWIAQQVLGARIRYNRRTLPTLVGLRPGRLRRGTPAGGRGRPGRRPLPARR